MSHTCAIHECNKNGHTLVTLTYYTLTVSLLPVEDWLPLDAFAKDVETSIDADQRPASSFPDAVTSALTVSANSDVDENSSEVKSALGTSRSTMQSPDTDANALYFPEPRSCEKRLSLLRPADREDCHVREDARKYVSKKTFL